MDTDTDDDPEVGAYMSFPGIKETMEALHMKTEDANLRISREKVFQRDSKDSVEFCRVCNETTNQVPSSDGSGSRFCRRRLRTCTSSGSERSSHSSVAVVKRGRAPDCTMTRDEKRGG